MIITGKSSPLRNQIDDEYEFDDDEDKYDDEEDDQDDEDDQDKEHFINPRIPRWRQPLKQVDFSDTKPDTRCPCGGKRKYKNCHGARQAKSSTG